MLPIYSYVVFSDHCTLKKVTLTSGKHQVMNRRNLLSAIQKNVSRVGARLSKYEIDVLFQMLYPLTQVEEAVKERHVRNVARRH